MKQFDLKEYLANPSRKVVTRDGCPVRILCTDKKSYNEQIVGLIMGNNGMEFIFTWTQQGKQYLNMDTPNDLFFAPEKHEGWVNIYKAAAPRETLSYLQTRYVGSCIWPTEEEAKTAADADDIVTIKIEWEE